MDYEKKYKDLVEAVKELQEANPSDEGIQKWVEDNIPELAESKDEKIRKLIIKHFKEIANSNGQSWISLDIPYILAWLEAQSEHANFRNKIQIGDKVTRNEDGVLVNLSQLKRVAKKDEKQGEHKPLGFNIGDDITVNGQICKVVAVEQKPTDKVEPKFKVGDLVVNTITNDVEQIIEVTSNEYICSGVLIVSFDNQHLLKKWTIQDAKDNDWLKSLRPQPKYEWTEKDEINMDLIYNALNHVYDLEHNKSLCDWFNSLKNRYTWKPSDEQMDALNDVISSRDIKYDVLSELWKDLKKLKG